MKTIPAIPVAPTAKEQVANSLPAAEPTLLDNWSATAQVAMLAQAAPTAAGARKRGILYLFSKWTCITVFCAAVLWPVVDARTNYCFKTVPQYLQQEWVWWVKTTR
jgi:hypothetical protein